jgi:hypothetical protein
LPIPASAKREIRLDDGLLLQQANDLRIVPLLVARAEALRLGARLLQRHQRIAAKVKPAGLAVVAVAKLKGDPALGRDPHA